MGCDSPESNFNNLVWHDGRWGYTSGWDHTIEAPTIDLIGEQIRDRRTRYVVAYQHEQGVWLATPISGAPEMVDERATSRRLRSALQRLVDLKDGPKDSVYHREKPKAWDAARAALTGRSSNSEGDRYGH